MQKEIRAYKQVDGTIFSNKYECEQHDKKIELNQVFSTLPKLTIDIDINKFGKECRIFKVTNKKEIESVCNNYYGLKYMYPRIIQDQHIIEDLNDRKFTYIVYYSELISYYDGYSYIISSLNEYVSDIVSSYKEFMSEKELEFIIHTIIDRIEQKVDKGEIKYDI